MGMYRHKMPDREISKEMERANFWEAEADMWHQNYKNATDEIEQLRKILEDVLETSGEQIPYGTVKAILSALKEKE